MKKAIVFFILFLILATVVWGQTDFTWTGSAGDNNWNNQNNWSPNTGYPGQSSNDDTVLFNNYVWSTVSITGNITIKDLKCTLANSTITFNTNSSALTVTGETELKGVLAVQPNGGNSTSVVNITNLTLTDNTAGISNSGGGSNVRIGGALISMNPSSPAQGIKIGSSSEGVTGDIGNIVIGNRAVEINIDASVGPVNIGDITNEGSVPGGNGKVTINIIGSYPVSVGNVSGTRDIEINIGAGGDVNIGNVTAPGGNATVNAGTGSTVNIDEIDDSDGSPTITGGGSGGVTTGGANNFTWKATAVSSDWTDGANWEGSSSPGNGIAAYKIFINNSTNPPVFSGTELICGTLTIRTGASLDMGAYNLTVTTLANSGTLILEGATGQTVSGVGTSNAGNVTYNNNGTNFAGLTNFNNLTITNGARTGVGAIAVSGNFELTSGSLNATSINVTGTSLITGDITTNGTQTYTGAVTLGGTGANYTLNAVTGNVTLGNITGGNNSLSITASTATFNGGSTTGALSVTGGAVFQTAPLSAASVNVSLASTISANVTSTSGNQTYTGNVTLGGTGAGYTLDAGAGTVALGSITGAGKSLTITGNGILNGGSGINVLSVSGTTTINANISTTGNQTYTGAVILGGTVGTKTLTGATVTLGTITGNTNSLTITGNGVLNGGNDIDNLSVSGTATINADITTTGTQTYTGAVTLGGTGLKTLTGTTVTLGTVTGNNNSLTIAGEGVLNGGSGIGTLQINGNATFRTALLSAASVNVSLASTINANITTTGNQTYTGAVTLGGNIELTGNASSTILFNNTVNGVSSNRTLSIKTANVTFNGAVGASFIDSVTVDTGAVAINADINTVRNQNYGSGNVNLGGTGTRTLTSTSGSITANGIVTGTGVTVNALQGISMTGANTLSGNVILNNTQSGTASGDIDFTNSTAAINLTAVNNSATGNINVKKTGALSITELKTTGSNNKVSIEAGGAVTQTGAITTGTLTLGGTGSYELKSVNTNSVSTLETVTGANPLKIEYKNDKALTLGALQAGTIDIETTIGGLTQTTAIITATKLTVKTNAGIKLESSNKITSVDLTAAGNIEFVNANAGTLGVTVSTSGNITITEESGALNVEDINTGADVTLNAHTSLTAKKITVTGKIKLIAEGNITLNDKATAFQLIANTTGTVTVSEIKIDSSNTGYEGQNAAIFIEADDFITSTITGSIIPGGTDGQLCLILNKKWTDTHSAVDGCEDVDIISIGLGKIVRWHQHFVDYSNKHLVYGDDVIPPDANPIDCYHVANTDIRTIFTVSANFNVYIYNAQITPNNNSGLTFKTSGSGKIKFHGTNEFTNLTLETASGGDIRFVDSTVKVNGNFELTHNEIITLAANSPPGTGSVIEAAHISLNEINAENGENLSLKATTGNIILNKQIGTSSDPVGGITVDSADNVTFSDKVFANTIDVKAAGTININADITAVGNQIYTGTVTLGGTVGTKILTGATVTLGTITGNTNSLTITGNGVLNGGNNINILSVSGTAAINADISTTGTQIYTGEVTLGGTGVKTLTGTTVTLGKITGAGNSLKIDGNGVLNGASGINVLYVSGTAAINADIAAIGNQTYTMAATLNGNGNTDGTDKRKLTSQNGNIEFMGTLDVTDQTKDIIELSTVSGDITISGKTTAYQLIVKTANGTVSVYEIEINTSNTGNEGEDAAIYIEADTFIVTATTLSSIIPGGKPVGAQWGQLCLVLSNDWENTDDIVDGDEDDPYNLCSVPNARWHQHRPSTPVKGIILFSFTEDSNGNGKLDRIRVQTNKPLNGDFSGFTVTVVGYDVDGFALVSVKTGNSPFDDDSFYIYLKEKTEFEFDGSNVPLWSITKNTTLKNTGAAPELMGDPSVDKDKKPIDTIPPRIKYALTIPNNPQTYVQMSEPVKDSSGGNISADFGGASVNASAAAPANLGHLFSYSTSYGVDELANLSIDSAVASAGYFQMNDIVDNEQKPDWSVIDPKNLPKYPLNWKYTEYAKVSDNTSPAQTAGGTVPFADVFTPPNKLLTVDMMSKLENGQGEAVTPNNNPVIRRVTDVLINAAGDNYFAKPIFAKPSSDNNSITEFDGTAHLEKDSVEESGIELQARIGENFSIAPQSASLELYWTTANIPADMRNPKEASGARKVGGLWLPNVLTNPLYYYVPLSDGIKLTSATPSGASLFNYNIDKNDFANSGDKFEFILRVSSSDMFIARIDAPVNTIPNNWYELIRPFSFDIRGMNYQRGGVTVLNNVINSDKKENAIIRYELPRPGRVTIQIYTLDGTLVKSVRRNEQREAGAYTDTWDGSNNGGRAVARGMYFVRVVGPDIDEIRKIMVVK